MKPRSAARTEISTVPTPESMTPLSILKVSADKDTIKIVSNLARLDDALADELREFVEVHGLFDEETRLARLSTAQKLLMRLKRALKLFHEVRGADIVIISGSPGDIIILCLLKLIIPFAEYKVVSVDLILQTPKTKRQYIFAKLRKSILSNVDLFINHFRRLGKYESIYGISHGRSVYIPFKVNETPDHDVSPPPPGNYVLCTGRTRRDVRTFVDAIRLSGCPGVLHQESAAIINSHGTETWKGEVPDNLTYVIDDSKEAFIKYISNARIVVIPRFRDDIAPAGIATYLSAMIRRRCCILSEGPGHDDVLTKGQAVIVAPEDPQELAKAIKKIWEDHELRSSIAESGYAYARSVGDEKRLHSDILSVSLEVLRGRTPHKRA